MLQHMDLINKLCNDCNGKKNKKQNKKIPFVATP